MKDYCTNTIDNCNTILVVIVVTAQVAYQVYFFPGLIEHEGRDVVIALKTKQAIRYVIAKALKNLSFLWSRGIIDKHEGIEMNKVVMQSPPCVVLEAQASQDVTRGEVWGKRLTMGATLTIPGIFNAHGNQSQCCLACFSSWNTLAASD